MTFEDYTTEQDHALTKLIDAMSHTYRSTGIRAPCVNGPPAHTRMWISENRADQNTAKTACMTCPLLTACETYITRYPHEAGIYAATTHNQRLKGHNR